jgi:hypothetical protein
LKIKWPTYEALSSAGRGRSGAVHPLLLCLLGIMFKQRHNFISTSAVILTVTIDHCRFWTTWCTHSLKANYICVYLEVPLDFKMHTGFRQHFPGSALCHMHQKMVWHIYNHSAVFVQRNF